MSGPVATMPGIGSAVTSSRTTVMRGCDVDALVHAAREDVAIDGERACRPARAPRRRPSRITRAEQAHLGLEQSVRVGRLGALERVRAHQLGEAIGLVRRRAAHGAHLVQHDVVPALGELPRGLAAGESAADDVNRIADACHRTHDATRT